MSRLITFVKRKMDFEEIESEILEHKKHMGNDYIQHCINSSDMWGYSALHYAVKRLMPKVVNLLLIHGADINQQCHFGFTPLMVACHLGDLDMVKLLLDNNADVSISSGGGVTAASIAENVFSKESTKLLECYKLVEDKTEKKPTGQTFTFSVKAGGSAQDSDGNVLVSTGATQ